MIRPLTIVTFLTACGSGLYLYQSKHEAQVLDRDIERIVRDTGTLREQSRLLAAEWTMLNDPETLRKFSDQYLQLKSIAPTQFTSLADLNGRLPAMQLLTTPANLSDTTDEDDDAPSPVSAAAPPTATPPVQAPSPATTQPAPLPLVAGKEPKVPPAAAPPAAPIVAAAKPQPDHPSDRKLIALAKPSPVSPTFAVRGPEMHPADARASDLHAGLPSTVALATHPVGTPAQLPARPTGSTALATGRPVTPSVTSPVQAATAAAAAAPASQSPVYTGSLLGMARTGMAPAPVPRPMPVSAAQWSNPN